MMQPLWRFLLLLSFMAWFSLHAAPAQMWLLLNNSSDSRNSSGDVDLHILAVLQQLAAPELQISPLRLGDARTWLLLQKPGNYCALSKIRTPERTDFLHFSAKPSSVYPPLQLVSNQQLAEEPVDLQQLLSQNRKLKIGLVQGRSYGPQLDKLIKKFPANFYQRGGEYAAETLLQMLAKQRLDAVIEFAATVRGHQPQVPESSRFVMHRLQHQPVIMGYLVCHKSAEGHKLIQLIDQTMQRPDYRKQVVDLHRQYFSAEDFLLINDDLQQIFQPPPQQSTFE